MTAEQRTTEEAAEELPPAPPRPLLAGEESQDEQTRQEPEIKMIEDEQARRVCFFKQKSRLFNEAREISILCGAEVGILVFSPSGKVFAFGQPSIAAVADRLLGQPEPSEFNPGAFRDQKTLRRRYKKLRKMLATERKNRKEAERTLEARDWQRWKDPDESSHGAKELEGLGEWLLQLKLRLDQRAEVLRDAEAATSSTLRPH